MSTSHRCNFTVDARGMDGKATRWRGQCVCGDLFTGSTYEAIEDQWREHVWHIKGSTPAAWGDKNERWQPAKGLT